MWADRPTYFRLSQGSWTLTTSRVPEPRVDISAHENMTITGVVNQSTLEPYAGKKQPYTETTHMAMATGAERSARQV